MAKKLTEEEKAQRAAERAAKKAAEAEAAAEKEASKDEEIETLKAMLAKMQEQLEAAKQPQIITMSADAPRVQFLWQAEVADDNVTTFGDGGMYGRIIGKTGMLYVPKTDLSRMMTTMVRYFLDERWLIVISGLDEEERDNLGVNYKEGEILDRRAFAKMIDLGEEILDIYPALCDSHKEMVAKRYNEAYNSGNKKVTREIVSKLHALATAAGRGDDFKTILERMNETDI